MPLTVRAPAKINLYLRVFPVGHDGFHPLRSWFRTVDLHDEVTVQFSSEPAGETTSEFADLIAEVETHGLDLRFSSSGFYIPAGEHNLAVKAAYSVLRAGPVPVELHLTKRIPVGAGLGGGSSDAAAVLQAMGWLTACDWRWSPGFASRAARLGADVPFFLRHQLDGITDAVCTGRGDIVQPFTPGRRHAVLLILPDLHVSTPAVYARFDQLPAPPEDESPDFAAWSHLPALELLPRLRNDLEAPAFSLHPGLARLRKHMEERLARPVRMTGSGSALFTLYDDPADAAAEAADQVEQFEQLTFRRTPA